MNWLHKHKKLWTIIIAIASLALILTSFAPLLLYLR